MAQRDRTGVDVYRNLNAQPPVWSVRDRRTNKVVAYVPSVLLGDVTTTARPGGVRRIRERLQKEVVAWVSGEELRAKAPTSDEDAARRGFVEATFNPYLFDGFVLAHNFAPVERAERAWLSPTMKLWLRLWAEDEALTRRARARPSAARIARFDEARERAAKARGRSAPRTNPSAPARGAATRFWNG